jgi:branched-chain amino acid transport system ATP-binding protein
LANSISIEGVHAGYGAVRVIENVSLNVGSGETVVLLGTNGNGKSTLMKCIMGIVRPTRGSVSLALDGNTHDLTSLSTEEIVNLGVAMVPEGRRLFGRMTVEENLRLGAFAPRALRETVPTLEVVYATFPRLRERRRQLAGSLSGGEQQMVAIGRALMSRPRLLMLDEPSLGLAPRVVETIFGVFAAINRAGVAVFLVEQNVRAALALAHRAYLLEHGQVVGEGAAAALLEDPQVRQAYLGPLAVPR